MPPLLRNNLSTIEIYLNLEEHMFTFDVTKFLKSLSLAVAFAAVLTLGQGVARADEVFIAGFTNG